MKTIKKMNRFLVSITGLSMLIFGCHDSSQSEESYAAGLTADVMTSTGCVATTSGDGVSVQTLYAGQYIDAGTVTVEVIDEHLVITYATTGGWYLMQTHLWVGEALEDMPLTPSGNPQVGQFPYASGNIVGDHVYTVDIPLETLDFSCPGPDMTLFMAAHAVVGRAVSIDMHQVETGWADGETVNERGSWATYFDVTLTCDCEADTDVSPIDSSCETAFGYLPDGGVCFRDLDLDEDAKRDFSRWGWTNGPLEEGMYDLDLYAAAGRCDLERGAHVGTVSVHYADGTVTVVYWGISDVEFSETHLYVGEAILPTAKKGATVAPGKYPYSQEALEYVIDGITGPIYVVAHAKVCGHMM